MAQAMESAFRSWTATRRLALIAGDIARGFMSTSRLLVTFVGCITLLGGALIYSNDTARSRFIEHAPAVVGHWLVPAARDATVAAQPSTDDGLQTVSLTVAESAEQRHITQYLARRYRVADEAVRLLVAAAYRSGEEHGLDPTLILAVMAVESSMNPFAESAVGAQGLMQVMTRVHTDKFELHGGDHAALDPIATHRIEELILSIAERYTVLIVTHNMQQAARVSDYTAFMYLGRLVEYGATADVFQNPRLTETEEYVTGRFG